MMVMNMWKMGRTRLTNQLGAIKQPDLLKRVLSHTAYHSGQIALALKYGK